MDKNIFYDERKAVAETMVRLYDRHLTTASGGNVSLRINKDFFCITPSSLDKGKLTADLIAIVNFDGTNMTPNLKLSIESDMHRKILLTRPEMNAVCHAHPIYASSFSTSLKCKLSVRNTAESYWVLKNVVNVPYKIMGSNRLADEVSLAAKENDILLLQNHGAVAIGNSLLNAFDKMELLERAAQMQIICQSIPGSHPLSDKQIEELDKF